MPIIFAESAVQDLVCFCDLNSPLCEFKLDILSPEYPSYIDFG